LYQRSNLLPPTEPLFRLLICAGPFDALFACFVVMSPPYVASPFSSPTRFLFFSLLTTTHHQQNKQSTTDTYLRAVRRPKAAIAAAAAAEADAVGAAAAATR
jgi:hypothetical protein